MQELSVEELKEMLDSGCSFCFLDVRDEWEYAEFNLGAENMPLHLLPSRLADLEPYKEQLVVVHCKMGRRGQQAQLLLQQAGFKQVRNLSGGIEAWIAAFGRIAPPG
ncbi:MAG: rhodanese-like domain-containing protein [Chitinophagales bacterium]|nr:rhodanese-like domain-containing protein [Chitinophagales bacterium]MDW8393344.1 rhodanese-like domain-containing protein [Chitinophagales bacterium]